MHNRQIALGISGSIAAYKAAYLARSLTQAGAKVRTIMTQSATEFITPLTFEAITGYPVATDTTGFSMQHIDLAKWADTLVIAPASASILGKLAQGICDNVLTSTCLAHARPLYLAPAMNQHMWNNAAVQENINKLKAHGHHIIGPAKGDQACGDTGFGRMQEPEFIFHALQQGQSFNGVNVLITAGPTQEAIDPVRYISNHSSGKMGYALAKVLHQQGAKVTLVHGPTLIEPPAVTHLIPITSANEMYHAVMQHIQTNDIFISVAAVADFTPSEPSAHKIKKTTDQLTVNMTKTQDILAAVGQLNPRPFIVGFAAETQDLLANAQSKLIHKNADMIVANIISKENNPFANDNNAVTILQNNCEPTHLPHTSKHELAKRITYMIRSHSKVIGKRHSNHTIA